MAKYCYHNLPSSKITAIEIWSEVIALRDLFNIPEDDVRFKVVHGDGADYVRQGPGVADVLLIDGFDSDGQPAELCSREFYNDCYEHLTPGGILVANLWDQAGLCIERLRKSFGKKVIVLRTQGGDNRAVFAIKTRGRLPAPDYEKLLSVHGETGEAFLPGVAKRMTQKVARHNFLTGPAKC